MADLEAMGAEQHGVVTAAQAAEALISSSALDRRRKSGAVLPLGRGIVVVPQLIDDLTVLCAATLRVPGAVASHRAAARLWELDGIDGDVVEITVPHGRGGGRGAIVHRSTDLVAADIAEVDGIRCTDALRTLVDLGAVVRLGQLERAVESGLRQQRTSVRELEQRARQLARPGRSGPAQLLAVLARRPAGVRPTESVLETKFVQVLRDYGVEMPVRQHEIHDIAGHLIGRVDFAYPRARVFIELDGRTSRLDPAAFRRDRFRQNDLVEAGWTPLRFTYFDVTRAPASVARRCRWASVARMDRSASGSV